MISIVYILSPRGARLYTSAYACMLQGELKAKIRIVYLPILALISSDLSTLGRHGNFWGYCTLRYQIWSKVGLHYTSYLFGVNCLLEACSHANQRWALTSRHNRCIFSQQSIAGGSNTDVSKNHKALLYWCKYNLSNYKYSPTRLY